MAELPGRSAQPDRVVRPLGLSIALLATAILYGIAPLLEVYFVHRLSMTAEESFVLGGADVSQWAWIEAGVGGVILALCILAWWGRPAWIRYVLITVILIVTAINLYRIIDAAVAPSNPVYDGLAQSALRSWLVCQLPALALIPLYTTWYLNRAPARAFYARVPLSQIKSRWAEEPSSSATPAKSRE
ncbi:MAG TPA: hypothetical protein PKD09_13275 [Aggregatilinea sp.]|jgi:hypothetical protein|uniref:hypothetical protein n=1 Tax=Aggregatilinea sp. TaxID=2806333 RepID=UPI002BC08E1A|nr:hypothetical protein [Aggregatilinea sp.]HML22617.1 hypothetical protein [Aggregatilinea sp.]